MPGTNLSLDAVTNDVILTSTYWYTPSPGHRQPFQPTMLAGLSLSKCFWNSHWLLKYLTSFPKTMTLSRGRECLIVQGCSHGYSQSLERSQLHLKPHLKIKDQIISPGEIRVLLQEKQEKDEQWNSRLFALKLESHRNIMAMLTAAPRDPYSY